MGITYAHSSVRVKEASFTGFVPSAFQIDPPHVSSPRPSIGVSVIPRAVCP